MDFIDKEIQKKKDVQKTVLLLSILGIISFLSLVIKEISADKFYKERKIVCVPTKNEYPVPMVYHQTAFNPSDYDARIKIFVEEFVRAKYNENIVDYHAISTNRDVSLSQNLLKAIDMSQFNERKELMKKYSSSDETYRMLKRGNMGWVFLIDDIIIYPMPNAGVTVAKVRGEFQVTYDSVKVDLDNELWGYKEITLLISQSLETEDEDGDLLNKYGYYVVDSKMDTLNLIEKQKLTERNYRFYLEDVNTSF